MIPTFGDCPQCERGRLRDGTCSSCGWTRPIKTETWHLDEDTGLAVPVIDPQTGHPVIHRCPDKSCAYYAAPPARVDDLVTGHESIAEMRETFRALFGRIGKSVSNEPDDVEHRRAALRAQAAELLRKDTPDAR